MRYHSSLSRQVHLASGLHHCTCNSSPATTRRRRRRESTYGRHCLQANRLIATSTRRHESSRIRGQRRVLHSARTRRRRSHAQQLELTRVRLQEQRLTLRQLELQNKTHIRLVTVKPP